MQRYGVLSSDHLFCFPSGLESEMLYDDDDDDDNGFAAAVGREPGAPLVIEEIMVAPPMPHEVRIRITCTSLCHSDITFWRMKVSLYF